MPSWSVRINRAFGNCSCIRFPHLWQPYLLCYLGSQAFSRFTRNAWLISTFAGFLTTITFVPAFVLSLFSFHVCLFVVFARLCVPVCSFCRRYVLFVLPRLFICCNECWSLHVWYSTRSRLKCTSWDFTCLRRLQIRWALWFFRQIFGQNAPKQALQTSAAGLPLNIPSVRLKIISFLQNL